MIQDPKVRGKMTDLFYVKDKRMERLWPTFPQVRTIGDRSRMITVFLGGGFFRGKIDAVGDLGRRWTC